MSRRMESVSGVWIAMSAGFAMAMLLSGAFYASGLWKRQSIRPGAAPVPIPTFAEEVAEV
jgi:hypothetical protein